MAEHEAAWAKGLAQEQAHQRELLATFRGELGAFAKECAAALTALDACTGALGDVATALQAGTQAHQHGHLVLDLSRRLRQLAPGHDPEEAELYAGFEGEGNLSDRAVGHARRLLEGDPKRSDRELLRAVVGAAGVRAQIENLLGPAPVAALAALSPLAKRLPGLATVEEREAQSATKSLASVLDAAGAAAGGEMVDVAGAAALAQSVREASEHAQKSVKAVEEGRMRKVIAEARIELQQDLDGLKGVLDDAGDAPADWMSARKTELDELAAEVEAKLERLERMAGWLQGILPRLQLASRALGTAQKAESLESRIDSQQPVTAEAARLSTLLELSTVWGPLLAGAGRGAGRGTGRGRMRPAAADFRGPRGRIAAAVALVALLGAGAGIGAWLATKGGGGGGGTTAAESSTAATTTSNPGPLNMRLYPVDDFLILQWINNGNVPVVEVTVMPQGFDAVSATDCKLVSSARTTSGLSSPSGVLLCKENIPPGPEPSSIRIDTKPPGSTGSVIVTYKDSHGQMFGPTQVDLTQEQTSSSTGTTTEGFAPNTVFDGCIAIDPQGSTTVLSAAFTVSNPESGTYKASFAQSPTGELSGSGGATGGGNPIVVPMRATAFGTYGALTITAPDGSPVAPGPLATKLPLDLNSSTDKPNDCRPSLLTDPPSSSAPTTPKTEAAQQYLGIVQRVNITTSFFLRQVQKWTTSTTNAEAVVESKPLLQALKAVLPQLASVARTYPAAAGALRAQQAAGRRIAADLGHLSRLSSIGLVAWERDFIADITKLASSSERVHRVLGLPSNR